MKRCNSRLTHAFTRAIALLAAMTCFIVTPVQAQISDAPSPVREFPKTALRAQMVVQIHPVISLNGKSERLSPGARIFDKNNYLVLSGQLVNQDLLVNYLRDGAGQIHQVWILNSEEAKEKRAGSTANMFDFNTRNPTTTQSP
jgi:hypothetical protein